jgi:hypothetical protein
MHWTQTPAGKRKMRAIAKRQQAARRLARLNGKAVHRGGQRTEAETVAPQHIGYAFGHCQTWLEAYADSNGVPRESLTGLVGGLLRQSQGGKVLRTRD